MKRYTLLLMLISIFMLCRCSNSSYAQKKPNILFAIMDDVTYMHMSAYGCKWVKTPNFDRIARQGLLFQKAYTANAKCAPSRANILTGRNSWQLEEAANHWPYFPSKFLSFAEILDKQGYQVGYTGKGYSPAVVKHADGSQRDLLVHAFNTKKTTPPTSKISTNDYAGNFDVFLEAREDKDKPFFFWYGGLEPHRGYEYGSGIKVGGKQLSEIQNSDIYKFWPVSDSVKTDLLDYAFEIEYFDKQLGKMLEKLEQLGELNNTLIVVTSDNGMPFPRVKGQEYEYSNHLPLAMMWADGIQRPGRKIDSYVSFIDFAPTFLELARVEGEKHGMHPLTGSSLVDILYDRPHASRKDSYVLIGKERHDVGRPHDQGYPIRGIFKSEILYLHNFEPNRWPAGNPETGYTNTDASPTKSEVLQKLYNPAQIQFWEWSFGKRPQEELYNIATDPDCINNLAGSPEYRDIQAQLKQTLFQDLRTQKDPRVSGNGHLFDQYPYSDKGSVNFYERYFNRDSTLRWGWISDSDFQNVSDIPYIKK